MKRREEGVVGRYYEGIKETWRHIKSMVVPFGKIVGGISLIFAGLSLKELGAGVLETEGVIKTLSLIVRVCGTGLLVWGVAGVVRKFQIIRDEERETGVEAGYLGEVAGVGFVAGAAGVALGCILAYVIGRVLGVTPEYRGDYMICVILLAVTAGIVTGGYIEDERE